jgi:hypothetical protein
MAGAATYGTATFAKNAELADHIVTTPSPAPPRRDPIMITKFDSSYVGSVDL